MTNADTNARRTQVAHFYVLAGGKSRRFGSNKALFRIAGQSVIERVIATIPPGRPVFIVTNSPAEYAHLGLPTLLDNYPGAGPLAGIHAGLLHSPCEWNFFLACDFPCLRPSVIEEICDKLDQGENAPVQVILPETTEGLQPLCALWSKSTLPLVEAALHSETRRVTWILAKLSLCRVSPTEPGALFNLNTPTDLARLQPPQANRP